MQFYIKSDVCSDFWEAVGIVDINYSFLFGPCDQNFRQLALSFFTWESIIVMNKNTFEMGEGNKQTVDSRGNTTYKQLVSQILSLIKEMLIKAK